MSIASFTGGNEESREYVSEIEDYTCDDKKYSQDVDPGLLQGRKYSSSQPPRAVGRKVALPPDHKVLPVTYELMVLISRQAEIHIG
jgi:hypothetical protein